MKPLGRTWHVVRARVYEAIGWPGVAGSLLVAAASIVMGMAWSSHAKFQHLVARRVDQPELLNESAGLVDRALANAALETSPVRPLPSRQSVLFLIGQIQAAAVTSGLGWAAAEYRVTTASETRLASLEVRCGFKAPYPLLRSLLVELFSTIPAATLRELTITRPNPEAAEVEAKLVIAVLLQDEPAAPAFAGSRR